MHVRRGPRELVLRHDGPCRRTLGPGKGNDIRRRGIGRSHACQPFRQHLRFWGQPLSGVGSDQNPLAVIRHAIEDEAPPALVVPPIESAFPTVAAESATGRERLLLVAGARHVEEPLGTGQLGKEIGIRRDPLVLRSSLRFNVRQLGRSVYANRLHYVWEELQRARQAEHVIAGREFGKLESSGLVRVYRGPNRRVLGDELHHEAIDGLLDVLHDLLDPAVGTSQHRMLGGRGRRRGRLARYHLRARQHCEGGGGDQDEHSDWEHMPHGRLLAGT